MLVSNPIPAAAPKPAPTAAPAAPAAPSPTAPSIPGSPAAPAGGAPTAPAAPAGGAPAAGAAPKPGSDKAAPTKEQVIAETMAMTAQDAASAVVQNFDALGKLTVGGGTEEGTKQAQVAANLLASSSNLLQLAHHKATEQLRTLADELDMRMMAAATDLAFLGGQVALAGGSKQPVKIAEIAAGPIAATAKTLSDVLAAIEPKGAPAPDAPADGQAGASPTPPKPDSATNPAPDVKAGTPAAPATPAPPKPDSATNPSPTAPAPAAPAGNTGVTGGLKPPA